MDKKIIIKKKRLKQQWKKKKRKKTTHTGSCAHKWYVHKWTPNTNTLYVHCTPLLLESVKSGRDEKPQTITKVLFCTIYKFFPVFIVQLCSLIMTNDKWRSPHYSLARFTNGRQGYNGLYARVWHPRKTTLVCTELNVTLLVLPTEKHFQAENQASFPRPTSLQWLFICFLLGDGQSVLNIFKED